METHKEIEEPMHIDLTWSARPWEELVTRAGDKVWELLVGPGITNSSIELRSDMRCPYTRYPQPNFVAVRIDGSRALHFPHSTKDEPVRFQDAEGNVLHGEPTWGRHDLVRAFRLATKWRCDGRWTAFQQNVIQSIVRRFKC